MQKSQYSFSIRRDSLVKLPQHFLQIQTPLAAPTDHLLDDGLAKHPAQNNLELEIKLPNSTSQKNFQGKGRKTAEALFSSKAGRNTSTTFASGHISKSQSDK